MSARRRPIGLIDHYLNIIDHYSAARRRPIGRWHTASRRAAVIDHYLTIIDHYLTIIDHYSTIIDYYLTIIDHYLTGRREQAVRTGSCRRAHSLAAGTGRDAAGRSAADGLFDHYYLTIII